MDQSEYLPRTLGDKAVTHKYKAHWNLTCGSNSNMGSIAKAMKDALEAMGYSELRDYQGKTIEAYMSGRDVFVSAPTVAGKSLTRVMSKWHLIQDRPLLREIYNKPPIIS